MTANAKRLLAGWVMGALLANASSAAVPSGKTPRPGRPALETYGEDLQAFVRAAEDYCGVGRGAARVAKNRKTIHLQLPEPKRMTGDHFLCLTETLDAPRLSKKGIRVLLVSRAAD